MSKTPTTKAPAVKPRGECPSCGLGYVLINGRLGYHKGITPSGFSTGRRCVGVGEPPFVPAGA